VTVKGPGRAVVPIPNCVQEVAIAETTPLALITESWKSPGGTATVASPVSEGKTVVTPAGGAAVRATVKATALPAPTKVVGVVKVRLVGDLKIARGTPTGVVLPT